MIELAYAAGQQEPSVIGFMLPIFILVLMYFIFNNIRNRRLTNTTTTDCTLVVYLHNI